MEIDPAQLPVPDWGLRCPACDYELRGLPSHRCPECGETFDVAALLKSWTRVRPPRFSGRERPIPDWGFQCSGCRRELRGWPTARCPQCGVENDPLERLPAAAFFMLHEQSCPGLNGPTVELLMQREQIPYIFQLQRTFGDMILGRGDFPWRLFIPREFFFDSCAALAAERRRLAQARTLGAIEWHCARCGENNPGTFSICWNCASNNEPIEE